MKDNSPQIEQAVKDYRAGKNRDENFRLIDEYWRHRLISYFAGKRFSPDLQEDLTQEVIIRVCKSIADFRGESLGEFTAWVYRIAEHKALDYWRRQGAKKREGERQTISYDDQGDDDENRPDDPKKKPTPIDELLDKERQQRLREAIKKLPKKMSDCMTYHYCEDRSYEEIAILMRVSVNTVKSHLRQGVAKLKADGGFD